MTVAAPTAVVDAANGRAVVTVTLPDFATVTSFTVRRTNSATGQTRSVRTLIDQVPLGTQTQGFDYELPNGTAVTYDVVVARGAATETSPPSASVLWTSADMWLKDVSTPERSMTVTVVGVEGRAYGQRQGVYEVIGRRMPVVVNDVQSGSTGTLALATLTLAERSALLSLLAPASVLLFQAPPEYGTGQLYLAPGALTEDRPSRRGFIEARTWALAFVEVDPPSLPLTISDFTYQDLLDAYATYQLVLDNEGSYFEVLTAPGNVGGSAAAVAAEAPAELWVWPTLTPAMRGTS